MSDSAFEHPIPVRFGDCDPAGIVYFPVFFDWFHQTMEAWFSDALHLPYTEFIHHRKIGFPTVKTEASFHHPSRLGEVVRVLLSIEPPGNSSLVLHYRVLGPDEALRVTGRTVVVMVDLATMQSQPIPDDLRLALEHFRAASARAQDR